MWKTIFFVGSGGFLGSVFRFLATRYVQFRFLSLFPWGTMLVNVIGSFLIGLIYGLSEKGNFLGPQAKLFLAVGFCGGFTTFSSLSNDAFLLLQNREWLKFIFYGTASFALGLAGVIGGRVLVKVMLQ
jgi:CrcB protein